MMQELLVEQLADLLHAEGQVVRALPKMERAALMSESGSDAIRDGGEPETRERQFNAPQGNSRMARRGARSKSN